MDNSSDQLKAWLDPVITLAGEAGGRIMEIYNKGFTVTTKSDKTPLTEADMAAHDVIDNGLAELTPDIPILSEESDAISFKERSQWQCYWLVDPLDGTREFIRRNGEFTVNIALIENHEPVFGVVYAPVLDVYYYAVVGDGAFKKSNGVTPQAISVKEKCPSPIRVAGSRSHHSEKFEKFVAKIGEHEVINMGSSLKSCLVAEGEVDLYPRLGPTSEWDTAAVQCIVEVAGGSITDTNMQRLRYNTKEDLLNPHFFVFGDKSIDWSKYLTET